MTDAPIWRPTETRIANAEMTRFRKVAGDRAGRSFEATPDMQAWSIDDPAAFWDLIWDHFGVIGDKGAAPYLTGDDIVTAEFFPDATLNFAENLLTLGRSRATQTEAIVFRGEDGSELRWSWDDLAANVSRLQQALRDAGVTPGDRVAAILPHRPEAIAAMLAAVSLGATWASASPDFGVRAILDRFGQIAPKVLFAVDGYYWGGKTIEVAENVRAVAAELPDLAQTIVVPYLGKAEALADSLPNGATFEAAQAGYEPGEVTYEKMPFDHPLYIMFSSGTTGAPKCMIHRAGGVLLQHLKEHALHSDVQPGDRLFYYTTLGWMMWNWQVSGLAVGATLMTFDGAPFSPETTVLLDYAQAEKFTHFGISAKYIDALKKEEMRPVDTHDLSALKGMLSTGSPLVSESFDYVYDAIKPDLHLASISGGTDIVSCFLLGDPTRPVYRGELQGPGLGLDVDVYTDDGKPAADGEKGELVCIQPFPCRPLGFWGDDDGSRYRKAYFETFPGVWSQGDFAERRATGGFVIHGRSDATLNPGGVRIGTAEIYAEVEKFEQIREAVVVGQDTGDDMRVVLFVVMAKDAELTEELIKEIKTAIRKGSSPRHVPAVIAATPDIPRTKSGKITELAVRDAIHGRKVKNTDALANPDALDHFRDRDELAL